MAEAQEESLLQRIDRIAYELEHLKRDVLQRLGTHSTAHPTNQPSLFGCVFGGDITDEMIEEAKKHLFREPKDL
jgi:hypothetical protein